MRVPQGTFSTFCLELLAGLAHLDPVKRWNAETALTSNWWQADVGPPSEPHPALRLVPLKPLGPDEPADEPSHVEPALVDSRGGLIEPPVLQSTAWLIVAVNCSVAAGKSDLSYV